jgi:hypothetical protein
MTKFNNPNFSFENSYDKALEDARKLLGISVALSELTAKDVTRAYRKAALANHPDKHTNSAPAIKAAAEAQFKLIAPAKDLLLENIKANQGRHFEDKLQTSGFDSALQKIGEKYIFIQVTSYYDWNYREAAKVAGTLNHALMSAKRDFLALDDREAGKADFIKACRDAIADARPELEKHRGWSQVFLDLLNVLAFIGTAGIANGVAKYKWDSYRLFTVETDSAKKLHECDDALDAFEQAASAPAA